MNVSNLVILVPKICNRKKLDCVDCCVLCESVCRALKNSLLLKSKKLFKIT